MNVEEFTFPTIEFGSALAGYDARPQPYTTEDKIRNLKHIFNKDQVEMIIKTVGKSIYFTHVFTELAKLRNE